ncbi:MAG: hypothetical protein HY315_00125 [Acidobacteria bacterium]|nr:hypothetical protein [Acidobacteriota bacterium]
MDRAKRALGVSRQRAGPACYRQCSLILLFLVLAPSSAFSQKVLSVTSQSAAAGSSVSIPVQLNDGSGIAGLQFILIYDSTVLSYPAGASLTPGTLITDHSMVANGATAGRVSVAIASANSLKSGAGTVVLIPLVVNNQIAPGTQTSLILSDVSAFNSSGSSVPLERQGGSVTVSGASTTTTTATTTTTTATTTGSTSTTSATTTPATSSTTSTTSTTLPPTSSRSLTLGNKSTAPGSTVSIPVLLSEGSGVAGLQFILSYDAAVLSYPSGASLTPGTLITDQSIVANGAFPGKVSVVLVSANSLKSGSGTVVSIPLVVGRQAGAGSQTFLRLTDILAFDSSGGNIALQTGPGGVLTLGTPQKLFFAFLANGTGAASDFVLTNPSTTDTSSGNLEFFGKDGLPLPVGIAGASAKNSVNFSLPPMVTLTVSTDGLGDVVVGSIRVTSDHPIGGFVRFALSGAGIAGVGTSQPLSAFAVPVRRKLGGINTSIAIQNTEDKPVTLDLSLWDGKGQPVANGKRAIANLAAGGQIAQFINELFPTAMTDDFQGTLLVQVTGGKVAATALELGSAPGQFTALPVVPSESVP